jgi:arsenate reductase
MSNEIVFWFTVKSKAKEDNSFCMCSECRKKSNGEGFFRKLAPEGYEPISAATKPTSQVNPVVVQAMNEVEVDIKQQKPKDITEDMMRNSTKIVNMGCVDKSFCPTLFIPNLIDWGIEDPKGKSIEQVREIRDDIEQRVKQLVTDLHKDN